jgi:hypothetical protein
MFKDTNILPTPLKNAFFPSHHVLLFVDGYWFSLTNSRGRSIQSFQLPPEPRADPIFQPGEEKKKIFFS